MNTHVSKLVGLWRSKRNRELLQAPYAARYAFVGVGSHALQNLYPVLQYLGIRLKYVCCRSKAKLPLIERRWGVEATTSLDTVLADDEVRGVFICASPQSHYEICSRVITSGKYAFVEKPPCRSIDQLGRMIEADSRCRVMVGMQKRYSPIVGKLKARLRANEPMSYAMTYHTGAYPEGDPFTDLFIHPLDLAISLFGKATIGYRQRLDMNGATTVQLMLSHGRHTKGVMELSTAYSWLRPEESICVNTLNGYYRMEQLERLCYYPHPGKMAGLPLEKTGIFTPTEHVIAARNNFNPLIVNNQLYAQGFVHEIKAFADFVEYSGQNRSPLSSLKETYELIEVIKNQSSDSF